MHGPSSLSNAAVSRTAKVAIYILLTVVTIDGHIGHHHQLDKSPKLSIIIIVMRNSQATLTSSLAATVAALLSWFTRANSPKYPPCCTWWRKPTLDSLWWRKHGEVWTEILFGGENPVLVWIFFENFHLIHCLLLILPFQLLENQQGASLNVIGWEESRKCKKIWHSTRKTHINKLHPVQDWTKCNKSAKKWEIGEDWPQQSTSRQRRHLAWQRPLQQRKTFQPERRQCFPGHMSASCLLVKTIEFNYLQTWSV